MLRHLLIKNFAIISNTEFELQPGLNIITGETGAGKSIVIEAISLALGARADSSFVRNGESKAVIQLIAEIEETEYIITREIAKNGRNICKINGEIVTLAEISDLAGKLADIHGQYDNRLILDPDEHVNVLDTYGHNIILPLREEFSRAYEEYRSIRLESDRILSNERDNLRRIDFLKFELQEIDKAHLKIGEDNDLINKISILRNREKIFHGLEQAYSFLDSGDERSQGVSSSLGHAKNALDGIAEYSGKLKDLSSSVGDAYYIIRDVISEISALMDAQDYAPATLDSLIARLDTIENLKKKYGLDIEGILSYREELAKKTYDADNFEELKASFERSVRKKLSVLKKKASLLTEARVAVAKKFGASVENELHDLNFRDAQFQISVTPSAAIGSAGGDDVEMLISANRGESLKPLAKVASGGEISRIMLAIKNVIGSTDGIPTLIFDEIDSGISGMTAGIVGRKLREIAREHQVICITHLPQIASCADFNYRIYKESDQTRTYTHVERLDPNSTVDEIARLLGGETVTDLARANALELIKSGKK